MTKASALVEAIIEGIHEKKGRQIVVADLTQIPTAPCGYFVICTGNSPQQVEAIAESIEEFARKMAGEKSAASCGMQNAQWVAMDYGTVMAHVLLPEMREFYDIEHLWADAALTELPELD